MAPLNALSTRDQEIAGLAWKCLKTDPKLDFQKLADMAGFKNEATARTMWSGVKKRLLGNDSPASTTPKKRGAPADNGTPTPSKRSKSNSGLTAKLGKVAPTSAQADEDDNEEVKPTKAEDDNEADELTDTVKHEADDDAYFGN